MTILRALTGALALAAGTRSDETPTAAHAHGRIYLHLRCKKCGTYFKERTRLSACVNERSA